MSINKEGKKIGNKLLSLSYYILKILKSVLIIPSFDIIMKLLEAGRCKTMKIEELDLDTETANLVHRC
ncbi:hypothetical protein GXP75_05685 [Bacillus sp. HU-1818]|uniref:hypothetical protein n=1 Tax=Bacillus sp. HU-1818 TaxID=2704469 RepID=UPI001F5CE3E4|nr:hypothetical protein [Bacillus sp. HU-1818]MCI3195156.1 hypothetical protein [Bacillus sp. HU-1818]